MPLDKQSIQLPFGQGVDQKSDPFQIPLGRLSSLYDAVFNKKGRLDKRFGNERLTALPAGSDAVYVATLADELVAVGTRVQSFSDSADQWVDKGSYQPLALSVVPITRTAVAQTQCDAAVSPEGLVCTVYSDSSGFYYAVSEAASGAQIVAPTAIPAGAATVTGQPRVFVFGSYFIIAYAAIITATNRIRYNALSRTSLSTITAAADISTSYTPGAVPSGAWDAAVLGNVLYFAWNGADGGGALRFSGITTQLTQLPTVAVAGQTATVMSLSASSDGNTPTLYAAYYNGTDVKYTARYTDLSSRRVATTISTIAGVVNVASIATSTDSATVLWEITAAYSYDSSLATNYVKFSAVDYAGTVGTPATVKRGVGIASKPFLLSDRISFLASYAGQYQPSYFLLNTAGTILGKLAYSNGGGYSTKGLASATTVDGIVYLAYLYAAQIQPVNKTQGATAAGIQLLTGVNLVSLDVAARPEGVEIAGALHLSGGLLTMYDGVQTVEHGFLVWPDSVKVTTSGAGGSITAQTYYYCVVYEWTDAAGLVHRSAPSVPVSVVTTGATSTNTITCPSLRLTAKAGARGCLYRWSTAQQSFYLAATVANVTATDVLTFTDTLADSSIIGNFLLYTTGGILEHIAPPACSALTVRANRVWLVDAEAPNVLWYSQITGQGVPVEFSDGLTYYISPTQGAQGSTGPVHVLAPLDDKLVEFKKDALYYTVGQGPDATGSGNDLSEPIFIASTVGCTNPRSVVLTPSGLLFESDKGRWLLGRDLSTQYLGAAVEDYNTLEATSALCIPETNEVRITLNGGPTLVYDYFFGQWGFFTPPANPLSACLQGGRHTLLTEGSTITRPSGATTVVAGSLWRELEDSYQDGSRPVSMSLTTGWINLAGVQGLERVYCLWLLASYITPHFVDVEIAYDYNPAVVQRVTITPDNFVAEWGGDEVWGSSSPFGGEGPLEQWRIFLDRQKVQAVQITLRERYDSSQGAAPGAGLTLSNLAIQAGIKRRTPALSAARSRG